MVSDIDSLLEANCYTTRELAALSGRINSFNLAVGNVTTLMTKFIHMSIVPQPSWDSRFSLSDSVKEELFSGKRTFGVSMGGPLGVKFHVLVPLFIQMLVI